MRCAFSSTSLAILFTSAAASDSFFGFPRGLAVATVFAYGGCGGPLIPYRAGRVDVASAGVPEPDQDLQSHIDSFACQGFTLSEMIALVACGHAFGGARKDDFPTMGLVNDFELFHGAQHHSNDVIASDVAFDNACSSLVERMISTVPSGVTLTDVIQPIENKVGKARLFISSDSNNLILKTSLFLTQQPTPAEPLPYSGLTVVLHRPVHPRAARPQAGFDLYGITAWKYEFEAHINAASSIDKFWFEIDEHDGSPKAMVNNGGSGYKIENDQVLFDPVRSAFHVFPKCTGNWDPTSIIQVRDGSSGSWSIAVNTFDPISLGPTSLPQVAIVPAALDTTIPPRAGYTFFSANVGLGTRSFDV
ncbi:l-ascorbate oxidase [Moniliophthora roreri MCA 2997]|uniref:Peroxidase n=1 Tax=Moniliophthora roreri (strain MCA 2997) TaxID=1381753 RepID=V2XP86_MONRO|nr:l-ascorbate oxidase [Moniliophthora roreri MCA 2997]